MEERVVSWLACWLWVVGGAWDGCCPNLCGADGPFLELCRYVCKWVHRVRACFGALFSARSTSRGVWGVPLAFGALFQSPHVNAKSSQDPHLLWGPNVGLVLASTGSEGPRAFVSCQYLRGIRTGTRDVRRAPYYYVVGYSEICAGGQVQS